jgi:hypothetical protein
MKRIHYTNKDYIDVTREYHSTDMWLKPIGLWYSLDYVWEQVCIGYNVPCGKNKLLLDIIDEGIFIIDSLDKLRVFIDKYADLDKGFINWTSVQNKYDGFEVRNYNYILSQIRKYYPYELEYIWFNSLDCASGCLWNLSAIHSITKLEESLQKSGVFS